MPVRVAVIRPVIPRVVPSPPPGIIGVWIIPSVPIAPAVSPWIVPAPSPAPPVVPINCAVVAVAVAIVMVVPVPSERVVPSQIPRIDYNVYGVGRTVKFSQSCLIALIVICNDVGCLRVVFYVNNVFVADKNCVCISGLGGEYVAVGVQYRRSPGLELINILT
jgi:hypothetical protein